MTTFNWSDFLRRWSQEIQESVQEQPGQGSDHVQEERWLGYPGATEEQIETAEVRLGITLPPSYRAFLKASNGWRETTPFIKHLWSTEEISWFVENHPDWLQQWIERYRQEPSLEENGSTSQSAISDEDYFIYGEEQDCRDIRIEYMEKALEISDVSDNSIYLLNPEVITEDGEWEAWFLADWLPGADRYPSFRELMQAEYINSREIRNTSSAPGGDNVNADGAAPLGLGQPWPTLARDNVQEIIHQAFSSLETSASPETDDADVQPQIAPPSQVSEESQLIPPTQIRSQQWSGIEIDKVCQWMVTQEGVQPIPLTQVRSQQWPGIEIDKVCQWIVSQVEQTVFS